MQELITKERGSVPTRYEVKEDCSVLYDCVNCGTTTTAESDIMVRWLQTDGWEKKFSFVCKSCFKKSKDEERAGIQDSRRDQIAYAQSFNLAVASLPELMKETWGEEVEKIIENRQKWFYQKLTAKK